MRDSHHTKDPARPIDGMDDSKAPYAKPPEPFQIPLQARTDRGIGADRSQRSLDGPFDVWGQVSKYRSHVRWNVQLERRDRGHR
jgi:hypothetical protein